MMLCDWEIRELNMISPFEEGTSEPGKISHGLQPAGYDLRLGRNFLRQDVSESLLDPVDISDYDFYRSVPLSHYYTLCPGDSVLAETMEIVKLPSNISGEIQGKSTYARCFVGLNTTVIDPGFHGVITLEITNFGERPVKLYIGQGIAQIQFHRLKTPERDYAKKGGRYQNQSGVTPPLTK